MHGVVEYDMRGVRGPLANSFVILINALFFSMKLIGLTDIYPKDYSDCLFNGRQDTFDFIVVGGGSAGCSVVNRLSEQEGWSVLLLEAGDYPSPTSEVPNLFPTLLGTEEDWNFVLEQDDHACNSYCASKCTISKGKVLGGTSSINDMLYVRGLTEDYDRLAFESWGSNTTYTIFQKLENFRGPDIFNMKYGLDGPIKLDYANYTGPSKMFLQRAYQNAGLLSMSRRHALGFSDFPTLVYGGERRNMAKNFLTPIKDRPNFYFSKESEVTRILLTEVLDQRASGVAVKIRGKEIELTARKEVILTAGAINNAKLLLLSGLGPRKYLIEKNICPRIDLPAVGKNLQFHLTVPIYISFNPTKSGCGQSFFSEIDVVKETFDYIIHRTGCLSHTNINDFMTYISTKSTGITIPNIAIQHFYFKTDDKRLVSWVEAMNYHPRIRINLIKKNKERPIILFNINLVYPESRGQILLNETHYEGDPKIIPNFLSDQHNMDFQTLLSGFDFVTKMTDTNKKETEFIDLDIPNCRNFKFCTMGYVKCYIYNMAVPNHDVVGTTPMGAECDNNAVVKENLEVRSMRCLRVADSSVLNSIPVGNTIATDAMIGFRMAEILKEKWQSDYRSGYIPEETTQVV